jgi:hypothetical protein
MCISVKIHRKCLAFGGVWIERSGSNGNTSDEAMKHDATGWGTETVPSRYAIIRAPAKISVEWDDFLLGDVAFDYYCQYR